jgi:hypothetical protein
MQIVIDVETIPCQSLEPSDLKDKVKVPANYKKEEAIAKYREEHEMECWLRTALDPSYGELYCICWCIPQLGEEVMEVERKGLDASDEVDLLERFFEQIRGQIGGMLPEWIGHNVPFDLGFIFKRAVIRRVKPSVSLPWDKPAWAAAYKDTMYMWSGAQGRIKLIELCNILGIPQTDDISGSEVWDRISTGDTGLVIDHCRMDVLRTLACYHIISGRW